MKIGKVNRLVRMRHFLLAWMCLRSLTVVMMARTKKTTYIDTKVMISEPTHMASSALVAMKPWLSDPMMR